jgi:hypothetical protein
VEFYNCSKVRRKCQKSWKILVHLTQGFSLYESEDPHQHEQLRQPHRGIPNYIGQEIINLERSKLKTPRLIRHALEEIVDVEQLPSMAQIRNFLQSHRNNRRGGTSINVTEMEDFCRQHTEVRKLMDGWMAQSIVLNVYTVLTKMVICIHYFFIFYLRKLRKNIRRHRGKNVSPSKITSIFT